MILRYDLTFLILTFVGSLYFDNTSQFEKEDDVIYPDHEHTYHWEITAEVSPKAADPSCITYTYFSHIDIVKDYNTGLIGTLLICKKGMFFLVLHHTIHFINV